MKHTKAMFAAFIAIVALALPLKNASAEIVGYIFPATQVCDQDGNTIGCSFGGSDCAIIIIIDDAVVNNVTEPSSGGVNTVQGTESQIGPDLYQSNAIPNGVPPGYENVQSATYSHTGRDVIPDTQAHNPNDRLVN